VSSERNRFEVRTVSSEDRNTVMSQQQINVADLDVSQLSDVRQQLEEVCE
jgi:hypothetical protein